MSELVTNAVDRFASRTATYKPPVGAGDAVTLPYVQIRPRVRNEYSGRQEVYRVTRFDFTFLVEGADSSSTLQTRLNRIHRSLMQSRGVLEVRENGSLIFSASPAETNDELSITEEVGDQTTVSIYRDIDNGPRPISWNVDTFYGMTAVIEWSIEVRGVSEDTADALIRGDANPNVIAVDARASYLVDQVGISTRRLVGRVWMKNVRVLNNPFWLRNSGTDETLRSILLFSGLNPMIVGNYQVPAGYERISGSFDIDETENILSFSLIDREVRSSGLPPDVLRGDVHVSVRTEGWFGLQPVYRSYTADFEANLHGSTATLLFRALQVFSVLLDLDTFPLTFIPKFDFQIPELYHRNRIVCHIETVTPFALMVDEWDKFLGINVPSLPVATRFPTIPFGTGNARGSAYRPQATKDGVVLGTGETVASLVGTILSPALDPGEARGSEGVSATGTKVDIVIDREIADVSGALLPRGDLGESTYLKRLVETRTPSAMLIIITKSMIHYKGDPEKRNQIQSLLNRTIGTEAQVNRLGRRFHSYGPETKDIRGAFGTTRATLVRAETGIALDGEAISAAQAIFGSLENFALWAEAIPQTGDPNRSVLGEILLRLGR